MRLVVIGGVAAGLSAAARARRKDPNLDITVLEKGGSVSHGACGLPYFVQGLAGSIEELRTYTAEYFQRERNIRVRTGAAVARIEHARRQVLLAAGESVRYDRLVIATGARPIRDFEGAGEANVFTLHTPADAVRLRDFLTSARPKRALVIGAGYVGLEAAEALRTHALKVTIADSGEHVFACPDQQLTELVRTHLERFGIELRLGERFNRLPDGEADVIVLAAGLKPNVEMAAEAGVEVGRTGAIRVDERMETNLSGVYAAGDCAQTAHIVSGRPVWMPLGTTANKMGRVAGANAAGARERFPGIVGTSIVRLCGLGIGFTGLAPCEARAAGFEPVSERIDARDRPRYFRPRPITVELTADRRTRRLLGATVIGEHEVAGRINTVAAALTGRLTVDDFSQLDLAYAPPFAPVWDPLLVAAQQLIRRLQ
jgi:NADPH-dependent 2,4-dienoyl-CoA reductase/sulfur reductase-like enzyme